MKKPQEDPIREKRIQNEAIVDALVRKSRRWAGITIWRTKSVFLSRPSVSRRRQSRRSGKAKPSKSGHGAGRGLRGRQLVLIRWQGRTMAVPLSQLKPIKTKPTEEGIGDWHYWVAQGYCF